MHHLYIITFLIVIQLIMAQTDSTLAPKDPLQTPYVVLSRIDQNLMPDICLKSVI